ncbi:MAG: hypothetical protein IT380_09815 [Myxococcales bacterium]|nr:hypothetical protein [Myxococcales bacterium]
MTEGLGAHSTSRVVQVGASAFRLEGDRALVELSRDFVYPLEVQAPGPAQPVRLARVEGRFRAAASAFTVEARTEEELLEQLDYRLTCEALAQDEAHAALHAACVRVGAGPVLLLGAHLSGKSTVAAALGRLGAQTWSDDITLLRGEPVGVRPLSRAIRVRRDAARLLGIGAGGPTHRVSPASPPAGWHLPVACVRVKYCAGAETEWIRPASTDAMVALMESTFGFAAAPPQKLPHLVALISHVPVFTFTYDAAPLEGARRLLELLEAAR